MPVNPAATNSRGIQHVGAKEGGAIFIGEDDGGDTDGVPGDGALVAGLDRG